MFSRFFKNSVGNPALMASVANPDLSHSGAKRWLNRMTAQTVDCFWADCQNRAAAGIEKLSIPAERISVVYPGVESRVETRLRDSRLKVCEELSISPDAPIIGALGNLRFVKGHQDIILAAPLILRSIPDAVFVLVGDDFTKGEIPRRVRQSGLEAHFRLVGFREDPHPYLKAFDVMVQPSISEGLPRAILEAMSLAKPVIASRVGGIPEVIDHGMNGYLVPPADPESLAQAVQRLLGDPALCANLGLQARETVMKKFTVARMVGEFQDLYLRVATCTTVPV